MMLRTRRIARVRAHKQKYEYPCLTIAPGLIKYAGFGFGDSVLVRAERGRIVITRQSDTQVNERQRVRTKLEG